MWFSTNVVAFAAMSELLCAIVQFYRVCWLNSLLLFNVKAITHVLSGLGSIISFLSVVTVRRIIVKNAEIHSVLGIYRRSRSICRL